jgi:hypothetical protein
MSDSHQYVYAVLARGVSLPPGLTGLGGGELTIVPYQDLAAAVSIVDGASIPSTAHDVLRHEAIVEALRGAGPSLPVRFGTVLADAQAVAHALSERYDILLNDLARLGDKVECGLMVLWPEPPMDGDGPAEHGDAVPGTHGREESPRSGADYLRARVRQHRHAMASREKAGELARELDVAFRPHVVDARLTLAPTSRMAVRAAYLLHPSSISRFRDVFEEVRGMQGDLRFLLSGPWPPYSFVTKPTAPEGRLGDGPPDARHPESSMERSNAQRWTGAAVSTDCCSYAR